MSCFKFSVGLSKRLFSLVARYWWNDAKDKRYIAWVSKDKICRPKEEGGMAFKPFELVNDALLAKQVGRMLSCPNLLISRVYKARYFPRSDVSAAGLGHRPSWAWKSLYKAMPLALNWFRPVTSVPEVIWECQEDKDFTVRKIYDFLSGQQIQCAGNVIGEASDGSKSRRFWHKLWRVKA
ncbi:hypothetical protein QQ045_001201 [Rhodiola kirilowii]